MLRIRLLIIPGLLCLAAPSNAATVQQTVRLFDPKRHWQTVDEMGSETLAAIFTEHTFEAGLASVPISPMIAAVQVALVVALAAGVTRRLPRFGQPIGLLRYSAAAFPARLWIRATMARRPFERCDDKWSCKPSRPSSAPASTFKTSRTANPL